MPVGNGLALASAFLMPALLNNIGASDSSMAHATGAGDVGDVEPNGGRGEDELSYLENNRIKGHTEAVFKLGLAVRQPPPFLSLSPALWAHRAGWSRPCSCLASRPAASLAC
jgi:hypothetical protein